ncbi:MAG TPA: hypothetical protein VK596_06230 [Edaphobacter sp.]|nr:hypothetical protein [Edaphobacter sp.]
MDNLLCLILAGCGSLLSQRWEVECAGGIYPMQTAKYMELPNATSHPSIQQLAQEHSLYDRRLDTLRSKLFLTEPEKLEEIRLKKLKLSLKDEMERLRRTETSERMETSESVSQH